MSVKKVSRSVYVAQLRRGFLMRAHPDRFRNHNSKIRRGQASLLQALSERMNAQDFQDYTSNLSSTTSAFQSPNQVIPFVLEKRDGSLLQQTLQLDDSVENVLKSLAKALKLSGAASLPTPPPPVAPSQSKGNVAAGIKMHGMVWATNGGSGKTIDHQFDVHTIKGRDLWSFLKSTDKKEIEERRASRMDASAAALVARRLYSFQAIDGVRMGWSSASFAILLKSLTRLHEEHNSRFHVDSFYPLRLVFSPDDFRSALDLHGGNIFLSPSATQLQWLEAFQEVTEAKLEEFQQNRLLLNERTSLLQNELGVKVKKGHSCSSVEYHTFMERISEHLPSSRQDDENDDAKSLEAERLRVVVESPVAYRRARVTNEGIRVHSEMSELELTNAVSRLSLSARDRWIQEQEDQRRRKEAVAQIQWALGLQKVYHTGVVRHNEFLGSLSRMMEQSTKLRTRLSGYSLGISGSGQFCHLGDDGSLIIPHNWK
jgi:hypothetical protein